MGFLLCTHFRTWERAATRSLPTPDKRGGLKGSMQHWPVVYSLEFQSPTSCAYDTAITVNSLGRPTYPPETYEWDAGFYYLQVRCHHTEKRLRSRPQGLVPTRDRQGLSAGSRVQSPTKCGRRDIIRLGLLQRGTRALTTLRGSRRNGAMSLFGTSHLSMRSLLQRGSISTPIL